MIDFVFENCFLSAMAPSYTLVMGKYEKISTMFYYD
jgi:hypothetical protein